MRLPVAVVLAAVLLVAGCGTRPDAQEEQPAAGASGAAATFNENDVMFLQMMVPHHAQGIEIVKLGEERAAREEIKILAKAIEVTQQDEIERMTGWLNEWKQPTEAPADAHAAHGGQSKTPERQIKAVGQLKGKKFDREFLNLLIAHQEDALKMARLVKIEGANINTKTFAEQVEKSRSAQIKQMLDWLEA